MLLRTHRLAATKCPLEISRQSRLVTGLTLTGTAKSMGATSCSSRFGALTIAIRPLDISAEVCYAGAVGFFSVAWQPDLSFRLLSARALTCILHCARPGL